MTEHAHLYTVEMRVDNQPVHRVIDVPDDQVIDVVLKMNADVSRAVAAYKRTRERMERCYSPTSLNRP